MTDARAHYRGWAIHQFLKRLHSIRFDSPVLYRFSIRLDLLDSIQYTRPERTPQRPLTTCTHFIVTTAMSKTLSLRKLSVIHLSIHSLKFYIILYNL